MRLPIPTLLAMLALAVPGAQAATGASCKSTGTKSVSSTIKITSGTYDGGCKTHNASSSMGDGSQDEGQDAYFHISGGATVKNVILGKNGADGIAFFGSGNLDNITWTDVGEDAMSINTSGSTVNVKNITGAYAADKFFQINKSSTLNVSNCKIDTAMKAYRQGGGGYTSAVTFKNCDIKNVSDAVFRVDAGVSSTALWDGGTSSNNKRHCRDYKSGKCVIKNVSGKSLTGT